MKILLANLGTFGDILPYLAIGSELVRRGHEIHLCAPAPFEEHALRAGLGFHPLGTREEFDRVLETPVFRRPIASVRLGLEVGQVAAERLVEWIAQHRQTSEHVVVVSSPYAFGARIAQELLGLPTVTLHITPLSIESATASPRLPGMPGAWLLPRRFRHIVGRGADQYVVDPIALPPLNAYRARFGLGPIRRLRYWWNSPDRLILMFPDWFAPPQADWPRGVVQTGFPLADRLAGEADLDPTLVAFLADGPAPVAFTYGSEMRDTHRFFATAVETCRRLGRRGLLLTPRADQVPRDLPPEILRVGYVPFSKVLPACAALVHHSGIGTVIQALAAGVPQLVVPGMADQFDEAERVERLGVGFAMSPRSFTPRRAARALRRLLTSPTVAQACALARARMSEGGDGVPAACDAIERLGHERLDPGAMPAP